MGSISVRTVTQTWQRMAQTPVREASQIIDQMQQEQPYVMSYLMGVGDAVFLLHERETLFYVGIVLWQIMRQSSGELGRVEPATLDQAEEASLALMERIEQRDTEDPEETIRAMIETYPEPEVLRYAVEAIMDPWDEEIDGPPIRDEYRGLVFLYLKIVLDAMIASLKRPSQILH
jgi:hypothetical protein